MRKRQQFDAATSEGDDDPADEGSDSDAHADTGSEPSDASARDASAPLRDRSATSIDSHVETEPNSGTPFDSPGSLAGAPVDDHTPAWGATQVAAAMEAELAAARARGRAAGGVGLTGSAAVLARLEALEYFDAATLTVAADADSDPAPTRETADPTPDSGVELEAPSVPMPDAEAAAISVTDPAPSLLEPATDPDTSAGIDTAATPRGETEPSIDGSTQTWAIDASDPAATDGNSGNDSAGTGADGAVNTFATWTVEDKPAEDKPADHDASDPDATRVDPADQPDGAEPSLILGAEVAQDEIVIAATEPGDGGDGDDDPGTTSWLANSRELDIVVPVRPDGQGVGSTIATESDSGVPSPWSRSSGDGVAGALIASAATVPAVEDRSDTQRSGQPDTAEGRDDLVDRSRDDRSGDDHARDDHSGDDHSGDDHSGDDHSGDDHHGEDRGDQSQNRWHDLDQSDGSDLASGDGLHHDLYDGYNEFEDYDESDHRQPLVKGGHRWFRRQIRNYGPLLGLVPMALFGLLAWAGQQFSTNGSVAGLSIGLGAAAAPFLMIAGLPFGSSESYRIAVVGSIVIWLGIGWWASRRALAEPMPTWRSFFRQLWWLSLALGGGVLAAYAIALQALG